MKLSSFKLTNTKGDDPLNKEFFAEVDVTTGLFLWKKTERKKIRRKFCSRWYFIDSGEFTPLEVEKLAWAWAVNTRQKT